MPDLFKNHNYDFNYICGGAQHRKRANEMHLGTDPFNLVTMVAFAVKVCTPHSSLNID